MFGSYWYIEGADGRHYCWSKEPSFECPIGGMTELPRDLAADALANNMQPSWMLKRLQHNVARVRDDETGRWSDKCGTCGHKLTKLGYRYWIEAEPEEEPEGMAAVSAHIGSMLGGNGLQMVEGPWYAKTKTDAQAWSRQRVKLTKEEAA